jgi:hypothetical protein
VDQPVTTEDLEQLVREHAALWRVATLVARQPEQAEIFAGVTREAGLLLGARMSLLLHVENPNTAVIVAGWSRDDTPVPVGSRGALDGTGLVGRIVHTGRPVRLEDFDEVGGAVAAQMREIGVRSGVAGPIVLGGARRRREDRLRRRSERVNRPARSAPKRRQDARCAPLRVAQETRAAGACRGQPNSGG